MSFLKLTGKISPAIISLLLVSCSSGIDGGSIVGVFGGITGADVQGPETVSVSWVTNSDCVTYKVYEPSVSSDTPVATVSVPPAKIVYPAVQSDHNYIFSVGCVDKTGQVTQGLSQQINATTWPKFTGVMSSNLDLTGTNPFVKLSWNYGTQFNGVIFQIYYQQSIVPGDLSTWQLSHSGGSGTDYTDTAYCPGLDSSVSLGAGKPCNIPLQSGVSYNFKVVAKYPDGTVSEDIMGNGTTITMPSSFTPPPCVLTKTGVGSDSSSSYLILRCTTSGTSSCPLASMNITAYQAQSGARVPVSNTLTGPGTLRIAPHISTTSAFDRVVKGLEVEYVCTATNPTTKAVVTYDGSSSQTPEPSLKYGSAGYETAPPKAYEIHPSYLGSSMAIGDFDCDGSPDLAVGLPEVSYNYAPYLNQAPESGAVKIYYDYATTSTGAITAARTEYLAFRDLPAFAHFGASLSAGNINKDVHIAGDGNMYSCDDLIIGAPGTGASSASYRGAAYVFYGQPQGFPQPLDSSALAANAPTCSGNITGEVCAPVRLQPNVSASLNVDPAYTNQNGPGAWGTRDMLGFSVAYIRDFNADGYGDVAIGNPYCRWDGEGINNYIPLTNGDVSGLPPLDVGCVYVYWGGPQGVAQTTMGKYPNGSTSIVSPFAKIYPPFPQSGMHFGWSISGGGDVDGRLPVPVPQNGGPAVILATGNDFVVGAPDFNYNGNAPIGPGGPVGTEEGNSQTLNWNVDETAPITNSSCNTGGTCPVDPIVMQGPSSYNQSDTTPGNKITAPWNAAWAQSTASWNGHPHGFPLPSNTNLLNSSGIAFLYLGRSAISSYNLKVITSLSSKFQLMPNQAAPPPSLPTDMTTMYSNNLRDRQNGSQFLTTENAITWSNSPTSSFYNCGVRGGPRASSNGYYKHISCLAGRNNFSVIYPTGNTAVQQFGKNVAIAGTAEQNAVALYQLGSALPIVDYKGTVNGNGRYDLNALTQGNYQAAVKGTSTWEMGVKGFNTPGGSSPNSCEASADTTASGLNFPGVCNGNTFSLARSIIDESYSFPSSLWNVAPSATPVSDVNKDGFADVLVTANAQLFTYFGNYAADFAYSVNSAQTAPGCTVTKLNTLGNNLFASNVQGVYPGSTPAPYTTFLARATGLSTPDYQITGEYPQFILPQAGYYVRASYLDDLSSNDASSISYAYAISSRSTNSTSAASRCPPQVKTFSYAPTSLAVLDANADGIMDALTGFSGATSASGLTVSTTSSTSGAGLASDNFITVSTAGAKFGTSVAGINWKFIDESTRRDLFSGGTGYQSGAGSIYTYGAGGNTTLPAVPTYQFTEGANAPNLLSFERSKIVGDVNGDGYDDIWVPIKRLDASGNIYYDAMIYYGSPFGPITYTNCMAKVSSITLLNGGAISASDCAGTASPEVAVLENTQIHLPQYLGKPTGVSNAWALIPIAVGDVNRDGFADIVIFDAQSTEYITSSQPGMYLFFGSSSGIVNGQPVMGASYNQSPQLVTQQQNISGQLTAFRSTTPFAPANASWTLAYNNIPSNTGVPQTQRGVAHGDFNGDGYEDIAFAVATGNSPSHIDATSHLASPWTCYTGMLGAAECNPSPSPEPANGPYPAAAGNNPVGAHGYIIVMYGGPAGYQTPVDSNSGLATDFVDPGEQCSDFYTYCQPNVSGMYNSMHGIYNTLALSSGAWTLDSTKTSCNPSPGAISPAYSCTAAIIRNPVFYDDPQKGGEVLYLENMAFGLSMTVADTNHDGIDDLVVGSPLMWQPGWATRMGTLSRTLFGTTTPPVGDSNQKGLTFIYYGAKGAGLVAPGADQMLGDLGLGLSTAAQTPLANAPVFQIYPPNTSTHFPVLDTNTNSGVPLDQNRNFGMGMTTGDFNGDGIDDVAIVSANGEVYVYYGPLCQVDNTKDTIQNYTYTFPNQACLTNNGGVSGICGKPAGSIPATSCTLLNLNPTTAFTLVNNNAVATSNITEANKPLFPELISVAGINKQSLMGSTLLSKKSLRSPASITVLKNLGNLDGDTEGTSDLVVGTNTMNDPNVSGTNSGLGIVFFGHKTPNTGEMSTLPGLYAQGVTSYNAGLTTSTISGTDYFFHTPVLLKPHTADGTVGNFFYFETSVGDLNGDGTMDLVMPSQTINMGADGNAAVISGGGFKLFY